MPEFSDTVTLSAMKTTDNQKINRGRFLKSAGSVGVAGLAWSSGLRAGSASQFGASSTAEEVTAGLDLRGQHILVTGANSGLGYESVRVLGLRGATVFVAARNQNKAEQTVQRLRKAAPGVTQELVPVVCELTDFDSIIACAEVVRRTGGQLDALICNAGIMAIPELEIVRGLEKQFVVNYLGHFLLAGALAPELARAPGGRLVTLASGLIDKAPESGIDFDNLDGSRGYDPMQAYGRSKLAMAIMAMNFSRRFAGDAGSANTLRPGVIQTELFRDLPWYMRAGMFVTGWAWTKSVAEGAATQCFVATHPAVKNVSGKFFADCQVIDPENVHVFDAALGERLWDASLDQLGEHRKAIRSVS